VSDVSCMSRAKCSLFVGRFEPSMLRDMLLLLVLMRDSS
jgi:hypothetical protein